MEKPEWYITNKVASGKLHLVLDLFGMMEALILHMPPQLREVEYEPEQFPGAVLKLKKPWCSLLVFKNGKIICAGCKTEKEIEEAVKKVYRILKPLAIQVKKGAEEVEYKLQNLVAAGKLGYSVDLFKAYSVLQEEGESRGLREVEYEPEQFPGMILKLTKPRCSLLVFKNGKIICAGCKTEKEIEEAVKKVHRMLKRFSEE